MLDVAGRALHMHRQPTVGGYAEVDTVREPGTLAPQALPAAAIDLAGLPGYRRYFFLARGWAWSYTWAKCWKSRCV